MSSYDCWFLVIAIPATIPLIDPAIREYAMVHELQYSIGSNMFTRIPHQTDFSIQPLPTMHVISIGPLKDG